MTVFTLKSSEIVSSVSVKPPANFDKSTSGSYVNKPQMSRKLHHTHLDTFVIILTILVLAINTTTYHITPQHELNNFPEYHYETQSVLYKCTIFSRRSLLLHDFRDKKYKLYISVLLIIQSSDTELNPGPRKIKYPCQVCNKAVTWKHKAIACDNCLLWYHKDCMNMPMMIYKALELSNTSWICCSCGIPNFATSLFDSFMSDSINQFSAL